MVAFRRHENWDHTASIVAAIYQSSCAEEGKIFWPEAQHPGYEPVDEDAESVGDKRLPVGAVPQTMVFDVMKQTCVRD
ncbi:MAG: hypothetical protein U9N87_08855 [Planctomycetota bacterium]|nr:hypothetical protein [Planctomycetota bacterium]